MAKYCYHCGTQLSDDARFCRSCGTKVHEEKPAKRYCTSCGKELSPDAVFCPACGARADGGTNGQSTPALVRQTNRPQQLPAQPPQQVRQAVPAKKGHGCLVALLVVFLIAAVGVVCYFGFREGGWFRGTGGSDLQGRPTTYDGENSLDAILDYAERLEKAGNPEAAAKVRALIPKAAAGEANRKIEEYKQNNEDLRRMEGIRDAVRIADAMNGGK